MHTACSDWQVGCQTGVQSTKYWLRYPMRQPRCVSSPSPAKAPCRGARDRDKSGKLGELQRRKTGDVDFGASSTIDIEDVNRRWFDHHLKGSAKPLPLFRYFSIGDNQ